MAVDVVSRLKSHCETTDPAKCWVWQGAKRENGYGVARVKIKGNWRVRTVARLMYALCNGPVPQTKSVLNTCGTKNCCNPAHLKIEVQEIELRAEDISFA